MMHRWARAKTFSPPLSGTAVHIWAAHLDRSQAEHVAFLRLLSASEVERASRFRQDLHARRSIAARGILRSILGGYLGRAPASLHFDYPGGKPMLATPDTEPLRFNLAHADDLALFAVTRAADIGVDVERVAPFADAMDIALHYFSPAEVEALGRAPDTAEAFYRCWTRKEAYIKALGEGLAHPLHEFDVTLQTGQAAALLRAGDDPAEAGRWTLRHLEPAIGFVGAVAIRALIDGVQCWRWEPPSIG